MTLRIMAQEVEGVPVLLLDGILGVEAGASSLREKVKALLAEGRNKVVLNMAGVTLIDSAGLGTLVGLHYSAVSRQASLRLCHLSVRTREPLQITRLDTVLDISATEADAVKALLQDA